MPDPPKRCAVHGCTADCEQRFSPLVYSTTKAAWTCVCWPKQNTGSEHNLDYFQGRWQRESQRQACLRVRDVPAVQEARPTVSTEVPQSAHARQHGIVQLVHDLADFKARTTVLKSGLAERNLELQKKTEALEKSKRDGMHNTNTLRQCAQDLDKKSRLASTISLRATVLQSDLMKMSADFAKTKKYLAETQKETQKERRIASLAEAQVESYRTRLAEIKSALDEERDAKKELLGILDEKAADSEVKEMMTERRLREAQDEIQRLEAEAQAKIASVGVTRQQQDSTGQSEDELFGDDEWLPESKSGHEPYTKQENPCAASLPDVQRPADESQVLQSADDSQVLPPPIEEDIGKRSSNAIEKQRAWEQYKHPMLKKKWIDTDGIGWMSCNQGNCKATLKMACLSPNNFTNHLQRHCKFRKVIPSSGTLHSWTRPTPKPPVEQNTATAVSTASASTKPPVQTQKKCSGVVAENAHVTLHSPLRELFHESCSKNGQDREKVLTDVLIQLYSMFDNSTVGCILSKEHGVNTLRCTGDCDQRVAIRTTSGGAVYTCSKCLKLEEKLKIAVQGRLAKIVAAHMAPPLLDKISVSQVQVG